MKVCIIGNNLSALLLSKVLVNKGIKVELCYEFNKKKTNFKRNYSRTIGLSNSSIDFLKKENILKANNTWNINEIELYRQSQSKKFLNFKSEKCFSIITYKNFLELLEKSLTREKNFKKTKIFLSKNFLNQIKKKNEIIINTENSNFICKKYFSNQIKKDYKSFGFTTILTHSKVSNRSAIQHFTNHGPLAFLPVSNSKTSVVFSIFNKKLFNDEKKIIDLIKSFNIIFVSDNLGYLYAIDYKKDKVIWAKNYKIPFRSNLKLYQNTLIAANKNNSLFFFNKTNGDLLKKIPTEETLIKNEFINNLSISKNNLFFLNTYGSLYSININLMSVEWFININQ